MALLGAVRGKPSSTCTCLSAPQPPAAQVPFQPLIPPPVPAAHTSGCCCPVTIYTPLTSARPQNSRTQEPTRGAGDAREVSPSIPRRAGCSRYLPAATNAQTAQLSDKCPAIGTTPRVAEFSEHAPNASGNSAREYRPPPANSDRVICSKRNPHSLEEETHGLWQSTHLCTFPQCSSVCKQRAKPARAAELRGRYTQPLKRSSQSVLLLLRKRFQSSMPHPSCSQAHEISFLHPFSGALAPAIVWLLRPTQRAVAL